MGKRAPILGIAGLIFLLFGLAEHVMTMNPMIGFWDFGWFSLVHIAAGLVCIVWFFASGSGSLVEFLQRRSTRYGTNAIVYSAVFVAVVVMLNYLGARYNHRFDMSLSGVNSLTDASKQVIDKLDGDVEILAFVGPQEKNFVEEVSGIYSYYSNKLKWKIIDPQVNPEIAQRELIQAIPTIKIKKGDRSTTVDKIDEESITNGIHKVVTSAQKKIYFLTGHGEPSPEQKEQPNGMGLFADTLRNQNYEVATVFAGDAPIPDDAAVLVVATGDRSHFPAELDKIRDYMKKGGNVLVLLEPRQDSELVQFVRDLGARVGDDVILDQQVRLFEGPTIGTDAIVAQYGDHPSVKPLSERSILSLARSVSPPVEAPGGPVQFKPLGFTSPTSWAETDVDRVFNQGEAELADNDIKGPVPIGAAGEGSGSVLGGDAAKHFRLAIFGDTSFLTNQYLRQLYNDALGQSVVGWLAGEEELISIAPRVVRASRAMLGETEMRTVFYLSVLILPELILLIGIAVWWRRSSL
ncbi:MAG TPA: GldG family protein [Candidatus Limnocylindrales bacterium]|nr:GldG family protein [Candidatus Limnocylindrales bacterium]